MDKYTTDGSEIPLRSAQMLNQQDVEIERLRAERDKLREIVAELADEVEADIKARYCHPDGTLVHESYRRKLDCDMEFVSQARAALAKEGE